MIRIRTQDLYDDVFSKLFFLPHSTPVDPNDRDMMLKVINSAINTKALSRWSSMACNIALDAVRTVELEENGRKEIDIKKYAKVEKVGVTQDFAFSRIRSKSEKQTLKNTVWILKYLKLL